ncbi:MAG: outer membrane beta-barrel protein [Chlorobiaceae bacterium]
MKKYLSFLGAIIAAVMFSAPAFAVSPYYISSDIGAASFSKIKIYDTVTGVEHGNMSTTSGIDVVGALGRRFGNVRLEAEVGYQRNNADKYTSAHGVFDIPGNFSVTSYMVNSYYDFKRSGLTPYLSAGIGLADVTLNKVPDPPSIISETHSAFGYQLGAGLAIPVCKHMTLDTRYRYFGANRVTLSGSHGKIDLSGSNFLAGLRISL